MKKLLLAVLLAGVLGVVAVLAYLLLKPTRVEPVAWTPPVAPALEGPYAPNEILKDVQRLAVGVGIGPEGVAVDAEGNVYAGYEDGRVIRLSADGTRYVELANTGGRPLGLKAGADGSVLVADPVKGLLRITAAGAIESLSTAADGTALGFTDDLDAADGDGATYFSDASVKFPYPGYLFDVLEHGANGRVVRHDAATNASTVVAKDLYFANGVAVGPNGDWLLVAETSAYRITRIWLKGDKAGTREVFADNLPGFPDNLSFNGRDRIWVALPGVRDARLDGLAQQPLLRKMMARLPGRLQGKIQNTPPKRGFVLGFDLDGKLIANLQYGAADAFAPIMSVEEHGPWLYFGSLSEPAIGRLPLNRVIPTADAPPAGWEQAPGVPMRVERAN